MALGDGGFRSRAASLFHPSVPSRSPSYAVNAIQEKGSKLSSEPPSKAKPSDGVGQHDAEKTCISSLEGADDYLTGRDAVAHDREAQRIVRTIPAWVHTLDEDDEDLFTAAQSRPLIPPEIRIAQHNTTPSPRFALRSGKADGRKFDHQRQLSLPLPKYGVAETGSRWKVFMDASAYPAKSSEGGQRVDEEWLAQYGADYSRPWMAGNETDGDPENGSVGVHMFKVKRRAWYVRVQRTILRSPIVPLFIRMIVWSFSAVALGLACSIHHIADQPQNAAKQTASTNMAIIVDAVAMVYLLYITYDEYSGKPLGLRPARAKMRLIFLDLFFIVFDSANLSLAFETIREPLCTTSNENDDGICGRQKGLASVLLIALIAWLLTFSISVIRLIEKVSGR